MRTQYSSLYGHLLIEDDPLCVKAAVIGDKSGLFRNDLKRVACCSCCSATQRVVCHQLHEKRSGGFVSCLFVSFLPILLLLGRSSTSNQPEPNQLAQQHLPNNLHRYPRVKSVFFVHLPRIQPCMSKNMCAGEGGGAGRGGGGASSHALHISVV